MLIERQGECGLLRSVLGSVREGRSATALVVGQPGTGRSALLAWTAVSAERMGAGVASARATSLGAGLPLDVAAQLLSSLSGHRPHRSRPSGPECPAQVTRALTAFAARTPLVLLVDDVQWCDPESEVVLGMLVRRLHRAPVALVVATTGRRPRDWGGSTVDDDGVDGGVVVRLRPWPEAGVREACGRACGPATPEPEFVRTALDTTGGNPGVLVPALADLARTGGRAEKADSLRFATLAAARRATQVSAQLDTLPRESLHLLRALVVTRGGVDLTLAAHLAGLGGPTSAVVGDLRATGMIVGDDHIRPADQIVEDRVLAGMSSRERADLHGAVAELAHRVAAPDEVVAHALLGTRPGGVAFAATVLRRAAEQAARAGADRQAVELLERALAEPLPVADRSAVRLNLAAVHVRDRPQVSDRALVRVIDDDGPPADHLRAAELLLTRGNATLVHRSLSSRPSLPETPGSLALQDLARGLVHLPPIDRPPEAPVPDPAAAGVLAMRLAARGTDLERVRALAEAAVAASWAEQPLVLPRIAACAALSLADQAGAAETELSSMLARASGGRQPIPTAAVLLTLGALAARCGRLDEAMEHLTAAHDLVPLSSWHPLVRPFLVAWKAIVELEQGRVDAAAATVAVPLPADCELGSAWAFLLYARGALAVAIGTPDAALSDLAECGRRLSGRGLDNPALVPWRPLTARVHRALGANDEAYSLLVREKQAAEAWGTASAIGAAATAWGVFTADAEWLASADHMLRGTPVRLTHARARAALAAVRLSRGGGREATQALEQACADARRLGALSLRTDIDWQLREAAGRPAPADDLGLTAAERKTVELAVTGMSNQVIAEFLSVTRRAVEHHLTSAYRKLGVPGRAGLAEALSAGTKGR